MDKDTQDTFVWQGKNQHGHSVKGELLAQSLVLAKAKLREQKIIVSKIRKKPRSISILGKKKIKTSDICFFTRQLSTMLNSGIALVQSFDIVARGTHNIAMRNLINNMRVDIEGGLSLADTLAKHKRIFGGLYINLVIAGEKSGSLDSMLLRLAEYLEKSEAIRAKIKKAMTYPIVIIVIALSITTGLLMFVVPQFQQVFDSFGADLPLPTQIVIDLSKFIGQYWWLILGIIVGGTLGFFKAKKKSTRFRESVERFSLKIPVIGEVLRKASIARFARTLATTFAAGLPLVDALQSVAGATGNVVYKNATISIRDEVTTGQRMQVAMDHTGVFPSMVIQMASIGEEAGSLEFMLSKVADIYEAEVDNTVDNLSSLMEPVIMVILGVLIGGLVIAMYMPIFQLSAVMS